MKMLTTAGPNAKICGFKKAIDGGQTGQANFNHSTTSTVPLGAGADLGN